MQEDGYECSSLSRQAILMVSKRRMMRNRYTTTRRMFRMKDESGVDPLM